MTRLFSGKIRFHISIILFTLLATASLRSTSVKPGYQSYRQPESVVSNLIEGAYKILNINDQSDKEQTQTTAYLNRNKLRKNLDQHYSYNIDSIGRRFFESLFKSAIEREVRFANTYRVFYHGQDRVFILFQDVHEALYKLVHKKALQDFIMLRSFDKDFATFKSVQGFLKHCLTHGDFKRGSFDHQEHIKKQLLAVNPSLFGNTYSPGESTFYYFLNSRNVSHINILNLLKDTFHSFGFDHYFSQYEEEFRELNNLLASKEKAKTGGLLQIFIPNRVVDTLSYRSHAYGKPFYNDMKPEQHPASKDLDEYKKETGWGDHAVDQTQFRLLINQTMLDPMSGIKIFRYCNETDNIKVYKRKLKNIFDMINNDLSRSRTRTYRTHYSSAVTFA